jgi:hypothetical protein
MAIQEWFEARRRQRNQKVLRDYRISRLSTLVRAAIPALSKELVRPLAQKSCTERHDYGTTSYVTNDQSELMDFSPPSAAAPSHEAFVDACASLLESAHCSYEDVSRAVAFILRDLPVRTWAEMNSESPYYPLTHVDAHAASVYGRLIAWTEFEGPDLDALGSRLDDLRSRLIRHLAGGRDRPLSE